MHLSNVILIIAIICTGLTVYYTEKPDSSGSNSTFKTCTVIYEVKKGQTLQEVIDFDQVYLNNCSNSSV